MNSVLRRILVIIDPQNCFMDLTGRKMPLPVVGAVADMRRLARLLWEKPWRYEAVLVTLDTHTADHIAHAVRWLDRMGNHPEPMTIITYAEYLRGDWRAADPAEQHMQGEYLRMLEATGRQHTIWPVHGQKGDFEWMVFAELQTALDNWEKVTGNKVTYVEKGLHRDTEQFGVFAANVPVPGASETHLNRRLGDLIRSYDLSDWGGEAEGHCMQDSMNQFLDYIPLDECRNVQLLTDATSPVSKVIDPKTGETVVDFPALATKWREGLPMRGVQLGTVADLLAA